MPVPLSICIEDLDPGPRQPRFVRCVAVVGRQPGLRITEGAAVVWRTEADVACELWVSGDDRMILYRREGASPVCLTRGRRVLEVPEGKPVVMVDQDVFEVGAKRMRLHVHGVAPAVTEPTPLPEHRPGQAARVAAMVALGAVVVGCNKPVEVRDAPPAVAPPTVDAPPGPEASPGETGSTATAPPTEATIAVSATPPPASTAPGTVEPIEVRETPPDMPPE